MSAPEYQTPPPPPPSPFGPVGTSADERLWAMLCHLSTLCGHFFPFGNLVGPLVIWLIKKDEFPLVNDQGKEALNFQLSITIYVIVTAILSLFLVGIPFLIAVLIFNVVMTIVAAIKANDGQAYRYPLTIRFLS